MQPSKIIALAFLVIHHFACNESKGHEAQWSRAVYASIDVSGYGKAPSDLWPPSSWGVLSNLDNLDIQANPTLVAHDVIRVAPNEAYGDLIQFLESEGHIEHDTVGEPSRRTRSGMNAEFGHLAPNTFVKPTLCILTYDWRQSNAESARRLKDYVDGILDLHPGASVDFLAHSMGGLVTRRLSVTDLGNMSYGGASGRTGRIGRTASDPPGPQWHVDFLTEVGREYSLEYTTDFSSWDTVTNFTATALFKTVVDPVMPEPARRFFKLKVD